MAKTPCWVTRPDSLKAIRAYCLECLDDGPQAVLNCVNTDCRLYLYRIGRSPRGKGRVAKASKSTPATLVAAGAEPADRR